MKVPFPTTNIIQIISEPNSVLDLRRSPSPVTHPNPDSITLLDSQSDDFDSLMREWSFQDDDPTKPFSELVDSDDFSDIPITDNNNNNNIINNNLSEFPPNSWFDYGGLHSEIPAYTPPPPPPPININPNFNCADSFDNFDYVDELIRLAECLETNSLQLGHEILARLNQRLGSPDGKPLQRAAFYFKEALQSLLTTGSARPAHRAADTFEIVQTIKAQKTFSSVSPIPMFAGFAANQAVLEALDGGYDRVHVIDFDVGLGGHWASFMKDLAERAGSRQDAAQPPPSLRVSAVVQEGYAAESRLVGENLAVFARDLNVRFDIEFVLIRTFEYLSFEAFKFADGERVAVVLSPAIFGHVGAGFLSDLRRISPHVVVHVDAEGQIGYGTASYRQAVIDGLEFYSTLLESLEAANFNGGDWTRKIETFVVYPKIAEVVDAAGGRRGMGWREALAAAGLRQVGLSQFSEFQAVCLLRRVQIRGFHVAKRQAEMLLCWHDRPLVATSAWRY